MEWETCGQNKRFEKDKFCDIDQECGDCGDWRERGRDSGNLVGEPGGRFTAHTGNVTIVSLHGFNSQGRIVLSASISACSILMLFSPLYLQSAIQHSENILLSYKYRNGDTGERTGACLG